MFNLRELVFENNITRSSPVVYLLPSVTKNNVPHLNIMLITVLDHKQVYYVKLNELKWE